jgi:hypothetical protein
MARGRYRLFVALIGFVLVVPSPAAAIDVNAVWPGLGLPGFRITPFFTERIEYDTNVLLQRSGEIDDGISRSIPGVVVELPLGRHRLDLAARAEILRYFNNSQFDNEHYFVLGNVTLDFPGGLLGRLREDFAKTTDPPGTELTGRIESTTNTIAPEVEYALTRRFSVGANYTWTHVDFQTQAINALDRDEHTGGLSVFWKVTPKTDLFANYSYGAKSFDTATIRDVTRSIGTIGVRGEVTSKLSSTFRIGYESRQPETDGLTAYNGLVAGGDWTFRPTERTRFSLLTQRSAEESLFASNLFYVASLATFLAEHKFGPKLSVNGRVFLGLNDYPAKAPDPFRPNRRDRYRHDTLSGVGLGVQYQIQQWIGVGADYTWSERDSNFRTFDYTDHIVGVKVTLSL